MKTMMKMTAAALAGALLATGATALAGPKGPGGFGPMGMTRLVHELQLTEAQQEVAAELREAAREDRQAHREAHDAVREAFLTELSRPDPDVKQLHKLVDRQLDAVRQSAHDRLDDFLTLHATLSDAQRAELVEQIEGMDARREDRRERMKERLGEEGGHRHGPRR